MINYLELKREHQINSLPPILFWQRRRTSIKPIWLPLGNAVVESTVGLPSSD